MSDRSTGQAPSRLLAVLGPTNTGKTHYAVERMLGHASGMIGLPLRLLAREIYDRVVKLRGARSVALITGEEKIIPPRAVYFVCTVEAMPLSRDVEFLAVDEIQLCADPERGHVFTHRLLHARGRYETLLLGAATMAPLIRRLLPDAEFVTRERFSSLTYAGSKKLTRLPRRTAVVAFSADNVYAIAELIRRQRGGAAVVMGSLSPRTRNAQVALYQSGEVDFLVATDAIGMGLNMDVDHVAFAGLRKFDGKRTRYLTPQEVGQIAGRAGRYRKDGTFGVTGEAQEIDEDLVEAVEHHAYEPVQSAEWRSADLDFTSLTELMRSLARTPGREGLKLSAESLDEATLRALARDEDVVRRARDRSALITLWDACQTPDFRKTTQDEHQRLVRTVFDHLTSPARRLPEDWIAAQHKALDREDGEIDALAQRLAGVRTLAYAANRPSWLSDAGGWQARCRELEDRLSDRLHEKLMQRFIDRRTSALLRGLAAPTEILAGVGVSGEVVVEGHTVGRLLGLDFQPERGGGALEDKALRQAAMWAVGPEITRRLGKLTAEPHSAFSLSPEGQIYWHGRPAGALASPDPLAPRVRLVGELGHLPARERAQSRLERYLIEEAALRIAPLTNLAGALSDTSSQRALSGLARGVAFRLLEAGGLLDRARLAEELAALSAAERRALKAHGVRIGAFCVYLPRLVQASALDFLAPFAHLAAPDWTALRRTLSALPEPCPSDRALAFRGLRAVGRFAVPADSLERLDDLIRAEKASRDGLPIPDAVADSLDWSVADLHAILRGLGFRPARRGPGGKVELWRRIGAAKSGGDEPPAAQPHRPDSPFAALAALKTAPNLRPRQRNPVKARPGSRSVRSP